MKFVSILYKNDAYLSTITTLEFETCNFFTHIVITNVQLITKLSMLLTFLSIWMSVIVSETSIIIRYFHELFCVIFFWNGILCMHSFSSIMMAYVIVQLCARYLKRIEFTNVNWYFINNDITYIKSNIIIDPVLISTRFYEIAQITYEKIFHVYARFFCLQYKI